MERRPPRFTRTDTLFPYTTLFRFKQQAEDAAGGARDFPLPDIRPEDFVTCNGEILLAGEECLAPTPTPTPASVSTNPADCRVLLPAPTPTPTPTPTQPPTPTPTPPPGGGGGQIDFAPKLFAATIDDSLACGTGATTGPAQPANRSAEHTSEQQSPKRTA